MTAGRLVAIFLLAAGVIAGVAVWYLQVHAFYDRLPAQDSIALTPAGGGAPEPLAVRGFEGIDSESSPIRYRACFTTETPLAELAVRFEIAAAPTPLNGPGWFSCYDARAVGAAIAAGSAVAFIGQREVRPGVDRLVAVAEDGRGWIWHQLSPAAGRMR